MWDNHVHVGFGHLHAFLWGADVAGRVQTNLSCPGDHFDFSGKAQSHRLEVAANISIEPRYSRIVDNAGKSDFAELLEKTAHISRRIGAAYASDNRCLVDGRKYVILAELQYNLVGVSVWHQAADRRQAVQAKLSAIVNDDQVDAAKLL